MTNDPQLQMAILAQSRPTSRNGFLSGSIFIIAVFLLGYLMGQMTLYLQLSSNSTLVITDLIDYFLFIPTASVLSAHHLALTGARVFGMAFVNIISRFARLSQVVLTYHPTTTAVTPSPTTIVLKDTT
jgi:hypothetical protein